MHNISRRKFIKNTAKTCATLGLTTLASTSLFGCSTDTVADTVVFGKIYTSNTSQKYASALAIKNGKYYFVGAKNLAERLIEEGRTTVIDWRDKGLIMASGIEGHAHHITCAIMKHKNSFYQSKTTDEVLYDIKNHISNNFGDDIYFTYGWNSRLLQNINEKLNVKKELDAICPTKPVIMLDASGHNALLNTRAFDILGIDSNTNVKGGSFLKDADGNLSGAAKESAVSYVIKHLREHKKFISDDDIKNSIEIVRESLYKNGYTGCFDGSTSLFGNEIFEQISNLDKSKSIQTVIGATYRVDPFDTIEDSIKTACEIKSKYTTNRFRANWIKLFADGQSVESKRGWVKTPYKDGSYGEQIWSPSDFRNVVKCANENGLGIHIHACGDTATQLSVDSLIDAEDYAQNHAPNCIDQSRNFETDTLRDMPSHGIFSATNVSSRFLTHDQDEYINSNFDKNFYMDGYPMKSLIKRKIMMTSASNYPANSIEPIDIFNLIELMSNATISDEFMSEENTYTTSSNELITVEDAINVMTVYGGYQLGLSYNRGSIEYGKYADFLLIDKDITACERTKIHEANIKHVFFEGKEVYSQ